MATIVMTDAQLNKALRGAAIEAVTHFCRLQGIKVSDPNLLRAGEAAQMLGTSRTQLGRLAEKGEIKRIRVGGAWKYDRESIERMLAKNREAYGDKAV